MCDALLDTLVDDGFFRRTPTVGHTRELISASNLTATRLHYR